MPSSADLDYPWGPKGERTPPRGCFRDTHDTLNLFHWLKRMFIQFTSIIIIIVIISSISPVGFRGSLSLPDISLLLRGD